MNLALDQAAQKLIEDEIASGRYETPEQVVIAALHSLTNKEDELDFLPGEWDRLIAEGEASGTPLDSQTVLSELRQLRLQNKILR